MSEEIKEILNNVDSSTKFKMVDEDGIEKEMNIAGLIEQLLNDNRHLLDYITNLQEEIDRLNNIINELEKWLKDVDTFQMNFIENKEHITPYKATLEKLEELKENK